MAARCGLLVSRPFLVARFCLLPAYALRLARFVPLRACTCVARFCRCLSARLICSFRAASWLASACCLAARFLPLACLCFAAWLVACRFVLVSGWWLAFCRLLACNLWSGSLRAALCLVLLTGLLFAACLSVLLRSGSLRAVSCFYLSRGSLFAA